MGGSFHQNNVTYLSYLLLLAYIFVISYDTNCIGIDCKNIIP